MAARPAPETDAPAWQRSAPTPWRALTRDPAIHELAAAYAQAQADAARARAALERLLVLCRPVAEEIARTYAFREADVADMAQEALLRLSRDLPQLHDPAAFPAWFSSLAHHACQRWAQRERRQQAERSLDAPARPGWLGPAEGPQPPDLPDPASARALLTLETGEQARRLLATLPTEQRAALTAAYLHGQSHEQIGKALGVSPRAAEGLVYRALRRLRTITALWAEEPEEIAVGCPLCGERRLTAQLLPGQNPRRPLWRRWRCPGCGFASHWTQMNNAPLLPYPSLDAAWWQERTDWATDARRLARGRDLRCWKCGAPVHRRDRPPAAGQPRYILHWSCFNCDVGTFYAPFFAVAAGLLPEALAFWHASPRLLLGPERLVKTAGEERIVLAARDPASGRRATLAVDRATLKVRRFDLDDR